MNDRLFLVVCVVALFGCGLAAGGGGLAGGLLGGLAGGNPQASYVPNPGDCIVLPQGQDPVYDAFYAKEVNPANCESFKTQEEGKKAGAEAGAIESETWRANIGMQVSLSLFGLVAVGLVLVGLAILLKR